MVLTDSIPPSNFRKASIASSAVADTGSRLELVGHTPEPVDAGYLVYAADLSMLYAVDERKTDGRGPVHPPAAVWAFAVEPAKIRTAATATTTNITLRVIHASLGGI